MICIGITCDSEIITDSRGCPSSRYFLGREYAQSVRQAGGIPILITPEKSSEVTTILSKLDGVVISGGDFDIPPEYYGAQNSDKLGAFQVERTAFEKTLVEACLKERIPVLGICGGMQLLNVVCGGTLVQDLSYRPKTDEHQQPEDKRQPFHSVALEPSSKLSELCGIRQLQVNSTHHQVIETVPDSLLASGIAPDGVIEAIELKGEQFALGVQWHPELLNGEEHQKIYDGLVQACRHGG